MDEKKPKSSITLAEAMQLIPADRLTRWELPIQARPLSDTVRDYLVRLRAFDLENTEAAKLMLIDALLADVVPNYPHLKVWKAMPLETDTLTGIADYLFSSDYAYLKTPLLCAVEAKKDDFVQGRAQCIAEMVACRWNNARDGHTREIYGIVSNGQMWQFYRLDEAVTIAESMPYTISELPNLLGALDYICAQCKTV
jgi:hypothetical protein